MEINYSICNLSSRLVNNVWFIDCFIQSHFNLSDGGPTGTPTPVADAHTSPTPGCLPTGSPRGIFKHFGKLWKFLFSFEISGKSERLTYVFTADYI